MALTDAGGNYTFAGVPAGGSFVVTLEREGFSFNPPNRVITDISADARFDSVGTFQASPTPTPDPSDDFEGGPDPDPNKWAKGIATNPPTSFDPLVGVFLQGGLLHIQPRADANGSSFNGLVSVRAIDFNSTPIISVEVVQAAQGDGAQTIFSLGADADHWVRFVVQGASEPTAATKAHAEDVEPKTALAEQTLLFQLNLGGDKFSASVTYDPVQHRFWRFRHDAPARLVIFETSPDFVVWTERFRAQLPADQAALIAELSAGTTRASSEPGRGAVRQLPRLALAARAVRGFGLRRARVGRLGARQRRAHGQRREPALGRLRHGGRHGVCGERLRARLGHAPLPAGRAPEELQHPRLQRRPDRGRRDDKRHALEPGPAGGSARSRRPS